MQKMCLASAGVKKAEPMTVTEIRNLYDAQPFTMHLADGRNVSVLHREFLAIAPSGRTVVVYQPDDSSNIIDLLLVTDLEIKKNGKNSKKK